jgi:hypothetical protein
LCVNKEIKSYTPVNCFFGAEESTAFRTQDQNEFKSSLDHTSSGHDYECMI